MAANIAETLVEKLRALPLEKQKEVLNFVESLEQQAARDTSADVERRRKPIWEVIEEVSSQAPPETWDNVPADGSLNVDHYLYGAPKKQS